MYFYSFQEVLELFSKLIRISLSLVIATFALSASAFGLSITDISPSAYQTTPLEVGAMCYVDAGNTVSGLPLVLNGATLIRSKAADVSNPGLVLSFSIDVRSQIYVCYDSRATAPSWLSSWVKTDMEVLVSGGALGSYTVYSKRFNAGTVSLGANSAAAMYFVAVKESLPVFPRKGWVMLTYDMPYLREIIKKAPEYDVNHIQLSHDIIMNTYYVAEDPIRRQNINEIIDLAHAYGITEVTLWTHEVCTRGMPSALKAPAGHPAAGHADGNNPALWEWIKQRYVDLLSPGTGCPEADGIVLTFSEVDDNVYQHEGDGNPGLPPGMGPEFKHDGYTQQESVAMLINHLQQVLVPRGKLLIARTWGSSGDKWEQPIIRDGILLNGDASVWMMNKNVGGVDWPHMDSKQPLIGTLPPEYDEMIEFDIGAEYFGRSKTTYGLTHYFKEHWNYALDKGADGAVARIDREEGIAYYSGNRLSIYGFSRILADPDDDPAAINLDWCLSHFPPDIAQDIADHYDDPDSQWLGDTRYMAWEAYFPNECPITNEEALGIAYKAIRRIDKHWQRLEQQTVLNTLEGKNDFETLHNGIATAIVRLGGVIPEYEPPSMPTYVQALSFSSSMIEVSWTASTDNVAVAGYQIYRNGIEVGTSTIPAYLDTGLQPNTMYSYRIMAVDTSENESAMSSPVATGHTLSLDSLPPGPPSNVSAIGISDTSVRIRWSASMDNRGVLGYHVYRNGTLAGTSSAASFTDVGCQLEATYSYTVAAYDGDGNLSAQSTPPASATTYPELIISNLVPSTYVVSTFDVGSLFFIDRGFTITSLPVQYRGCRGIRTANDDKDNKTLDFRFTINQPLVVYIVLMQDLVPNTPLLTGFVDTGHVVLTTDKTYKIWRKPYPAGEVNLGPKPGAGNGQSMFFVLLPYPVDMQPPSTPFNVVANAQSETSISVGWTASTDNVGVVGYEIYRNGRLAGTSSSTGYVDTELQPGASYSYVIAAFDAIVNYSQQSSPPAVASTYVGANRIRHLQDELPVAMVAQIVTGVFDGYIYVSSPGTYSGVRVVPTQMPVGLTVGKSVDVTGTLRTFKGERRVADAVVTLRP